jgi:hypothetical protein
LVQPGPLRTTSDRIRTVKLADREPIMAMVRLEECVGFTDHLLAVFNFCRASRITQSRARGKN